jgi:prepilin-type N-terminal cleavage/methylation domain-containing protein
MGRSLRARLRRSEQGFTLIELMIVVNLLAIFTLIAMPSYLTLTSAQVWRKYGPGDLFEKNHC